MELSNRTEAEKLIKLFWQASLAGVALAEVAICAGWVCRRAGRLISIYCLLGTIGGPLNVFLVTPSAITSASELPKLAWLLLPYLPPAMMCLAPYYVGVLALAHADETRSVAVASELAPASTRPEA